MKHRPNSPTDDTSHLSDESARGAHAKNQMSPEELVQLAKRLQTAETDQETAEIKRAIIRGFYGANCDDGKDAHRKR